MYSGSSVLIFYQKLMKAVQTTTSGLRLLIALNSWGRIDSALPICMLYILA